MTKPHHLLPSQEELDSLLRLQAQRDAERQETLRTALRSTESPLSASLVSNLINLPALSFWKIIQDHPGFELSEKRTSYELSRSILNQAIDDLLKAIDDFSQEVLAQDMKLLTPRQADRLSAIERRLQKELFSVSNAAVSLVDHTRRVRGLLTLPEYDAQLKRCFGDDGLREFVKALRVLLHHLHVVEAGWNLMSYESESRATFALSKETLLRVVARRKKSIENRDLVLRFLTACPASIDLKPIFRAYRERVENFCAWFSNQIAMGSPAPLRDYDRVMDEKRKYDSRHWWNLLLVNWLENWTTPPNPYDYLDELLTAEQLAAVQALPYKSKEQVDCIIGYVDEYDAIDDRLRAMTHELFCRAPVK